MVAHFADLGILAATAGVYGAGFVIATILRGRTLLSGGHGYGERITLKYLSLAAVYFSALVLYVAYSLDKPFGHKCEAEPICRLASCREQGRIPFCQIVTHRTSSLSCERGKKRFNGTSRIWRHLQPKYTLRRTTRAVGGSQSSS